MFLDLSGLKIDYDTNANVYYVSGDIALGPRETVTRKVEMKDIWVFTPEEIKSMKDQASDLTETLAKTQYEAQGAILKNDIISAANLVLLKQEEGYTSPQDHIVVYRENKIQMTKAESNLEKLRDLVVPAELTRSGGAGRWYSNIRYVGDYSGHCFWFWFVGGDHICYVATPNNTSGYGYGNE